MESRKIAKDGEERATTRPTPAGASSCAPAQGSRSFFNPIGAWVESLSIPDRVRLVSRVERSNEHGGATAAAEELFSEYASAVGICAAETHWILEDAAASAEEAAALLRIDAMLDDAVERASDRSIEPLPAPDAARISLVACRLLLGVARAQPTRPADPDAHEVSMYALI